MYTMYLILYIDRYASVKPIRNVTCRKPKPVEIMAVTTIWQHDILGYWIYLHIPYVQINQNKPKRVVHWIWRSSIFEKQKYLQLATRSSNWQSEFVCVHQPDTFKHRTQWSFWLLIHHIHPAKGSPSHPFCWWVLLQQSSEKPQYSWWVLPIKKSESICFRHGITSRHDSKQFVTRRDYFDFDSTSQTSQLDSFWRCHPRWTYFLPGVPPS